MPREDRTELFDYARVGYSGLLAGSSYGGPAMGVGLRLERESAAFDISFLNIQGFIAPSTYVIGPDAPTRTLSGSLVKIEALKFLAAESASSPYVGGGLSAGITEIAGPGRSEHGGGSQAELTAGIEFLRDSPTRAFIQADVILPFYRVVGAPTSGTRGTASSHYAPSVAISVGFGMHHPRRRYAQPPRLPPPPPRFPLPPRFPWRQPPV